MKQEITGENEPIVGGPSLLGDYLKEKRISKNFTLERLSQKTKISLNILKSLEANDLDHLPSAAYIKGFVISYVRVLGLPQGEAISKMESTYMALRGKPFPALNHTKSMIPGAGAQAYSNGRSPEEAQTPHEVIEGSDSIIENTKSMLPIIIFAVVVLVFVGGYKLISSVVESEVNGQKDKDLGPKIESSAALMHPAKKAEVAKAAGTAPAAATAASAAPAATAAAPAAVAPAPVAEEKKAPEFQRNFPPIEFKPVKSKLYVTRSDAPENDDENILPATIKQSTIADQQNVYIRAVEGNTWLSYKIDQRPIERGIIKQGDDLLLQGSEVRLFLGNVNVTRIFLNNHLIETPTKSGVKSLIFPEESNAKFLLPLFPKGKDDVLYTAEDYIKRMNLEEEELKKLKSASRP